jgi:hypothetical protein
MPLSNCELPLFALSGPSSLKALRINKHLLVAIKQTAHPTAWEQIEEC